MSLDVQPQMSDARKPADPLIDRPTFSLDRLPGLATIFELFGRSFATSLSPLCRGSASISLENIEAVSIFETLAQLQGCLAAVLHCADLEARALAIFDRPLIDAFVHTVFGARATPASLRAPTSSREITRIETLLVEKISEIAAEALTAGISGFADAAFLLERQELIADTQLLGRRDAPAVVCAFQFEAAGAAGAIVLLVPQAALGPIKQKLAKEPELDAPAIDPRWAKQMKAGVTSALIPINGVLEELEMSLGDIAGLTVGHVLQLRGAGAGRVRLESGGQNLFWCKVAQTDGRYTLEVEEPVEVEKGLLDAMLSN
jgi:flagellar motor switch protein FliM